LEEKRHNLKEINNALDVLLRKKDRDKKEIEENILFNIKETIFPYVKKLKNSGLNEKKEALLNIIESNLKELTSSFSSSLAFKLTNLTHTEIKIANLVKHGQTSKEIAGLLNLSTSTIDSHRKSIRKKLGIKGRKNRSLRALLLSIR